MKSYTDLEQSKRLAEILPLESADMYYSDVPVREWIDKTDISKGTHVVFKSQIFAIENLRNHEIGEGDIYAWSLAALLGVLESEIDGEEGETYQLNIEKDGTWWNVWYRERYDEANPIETASTEELIDACVEMIEKLHKQKLL